MLCKTQDGFERTFRVGDDLTGRSFASITLTAEDKEMLKSIEGRNWLVDMISRLVPFDESPVQKAARKGFEGK